MIKNKVAGFWIRFLGRIIDLIIIFIFSFLFFYLMIIKENGNWKFKKSYFFYLWTIFTILLFFLFFFIAPLFWGGKTLGMYLTRIKIISIETKTSFLNIVRREVVFGCSWIFILLLVMITLNSNLAIKFVSTNIDLKSFNYLDKFRIQIIVSISSIMIILQLLIVLSMLSKKEKIGFHDKLSKTRTVWINKYENNKNIAEVKPLLPAEVKNEPLEWM